MIELTPEQWHAIAQQENPTVIEPESKTPYVVVPKDEYDELRTVKNGEADAAYVLRIAWMRRMRLDEDEIAESLRDDTPVSIETEMKEWRALDRLDKNTSLGEILRQVAIKY